MNALYVSLTNCETSIIHSRLIYFMWTTKLTTVTYMYIDAHILSMFLTYKQNMKYLKCVSDAALKCTFGRIIVFDDWFPPNHLPVPVHESSAAGTQRVTFKILNFYYIHYT